MDIHPAVSETPFFLHLFYSRNSAFYTAQLNPRQVGIWAVKEIKKENNT